MNNNMQNNQNGMPINPNSNMGGTMPNNPAIERANEQLMGRQAITDNRPSPMQGVGNVQTTPRIMQGTPNVTNEPNIIQGIPSEPINQVQAMPGQETKGVNRYTMGIPVQEESQVINNNPEVVTIPGFNKPEPPMQNPNFMQQPINQNVQNSEIKVPNNNIPNNIQMKNMANGLNMQRSGNINNYPNQPVNNISNSNQPINNIQNSNLNQHVSNNMGQETFQQAPQNMNQNTGQNINPNVTYGQINSQTQMQNIPKQQVNQTNQNSYNNVIPNDNNKQSIPENQIGQMAQQNQNLSSVQPQNAGQNINSTINKSPKTQEFNKPVEQKYTNNISGIKPATNNSGLSQIGQMEQKSQAQTPVYQPPKRKFPLSVREMILVSIAIIGIIVVIIMYWPN